MKPLALVLLIAGLSIGKALFWNWMHARETRRREQARLTRSFDRAMKKDR